MKKVICDFCKKEATVSSSYILPVLNSYSAKDMHGNIMYRVDSCEKEEKDICPECERKIASLLQFGINEKTYMRTSL